jgi:hypothetical protein
MTSGTSSIARPPHRSGGSRPSAPAALIGMMEQSVGSPAPPDHHHERIGNKLGGHLSLHRPADNSSREEGDHGRDIEPALSRPYVGEVCDRPLVRPLRDELPAEKVGSDGRRSRAAVFRQAPATQASAQGVHPHQALHLVQTAGEPFGKRDPPDAACAISASGPHEAQADPGDQVFVGKVPSAGTAAQPSMKARGEKPPALRITTTPARHADPSQ